MKREPIIVPRLTQCPYEKPYGYVYMFTNKITGGRYIGKHKFFKPRIDFSYSGGGGKLWKTALKQYGKENFDISVLFWLEYDETLNDTHHNAILLEYEKYFIQLFNTHKNPHDYNYQSGGGNPNMEYAKGEKNYFYGKHFCGELNANWKGKSVTNFQRQHMSKIGKNREPYNKGVPMSPERLTQHTAAMRKLAQSPEWRNHQQEGMKKRSKNPEWLKHNREYAKTREKAVIQLTKDGVKLNEFANALDAAKSLGFHSRNAIQHACTGISQFAYGYRWMYKTDYESQFKPA